MRKKLLESLFFGSFALDFHLFALEESKENFLNLVWIGNILFILFMRSFILP